MISYNRSDLARPSTDRWLEVCAVTNEAASTVWGWFNSPVIIKAESSFNSEPMIGLWLVDSSGAYILTK